MDVNVGYRDCFLPCVVQSSTNKSLVNPPHVSWELNIPGPSFVFRPIKEAQFWYETRSLLFHRTPTYCTERPNSNGVYECDLTIKPCGEHYSGLYRCKVYDFDAGNELSHLVYLELEGSKDSFEDCVTPNVIFSATLVPDSVGTFSVNFSWAFAAVKENKTICRHALSVRSFNSSVPYDFEDKQAPRSSKYRSQIYTMVSDTNFHVFPRINRAYYYQFELRIQANLLTTSAYTYNRYSHVYHFSSQNPAAIVEPSLSHTVIRATVGENVEIPCRGIGNPSPSVFLLRTVDSSPPSSCPGCPVDKGNNFSPVTENDAGEYYCVAANTLVSQICYCLKVALVPRPFRFFLSIMIR